MPDIKTQAPKTAAKPSRLSESASFKVGGTSYTPATLKTAAEQFKQAQASVKAQTEGFRATPPTVRNVAPNVTVGSTRPAEAPSTGPKPSASILTAVPTSPAQAPKQIPNGVPVPTYKQASSAVMSGAVNPPINQSVQKAPQTAPYAPAYQPVQQVPHTGVSSPVHQPSPKAPPMGSPVTPVPSATPVAAQQPVTALPNTVNAKQTINTAPVAPEAPSPQGKPPVGTPITAPQAAKLSESASFKIGGNSFTSATLKTATQQTVPQAPKINTPAATNPTRGETLNGGPGKTSMPGIPSATAANSAISTNSANSGAHLGTVAPASPAGPVSPKSPINPVNTAYAPASMQTATTKTAQAQKSVTAQTEDYFVTPSSGEQTSPNVIIRKRKPDAEEDSYASKQAAVRTAVYVQTVTEATESSMQELTYNAELSPVVHMVSQVHTQVHTGTSIPAMQPSVSRNGDSFSLLPMPQAGIDEAAALVPFSQYQKIAVAGSVNLESSAVLPVGKVGVKTAVGKSPGKPLVLSGPTQTGKTVKPTITNPKQKISRKKGESIGVFRIIYHRVEHEFNTKDDLGTQTIGMGMMAGELAYTYFKTAQKATDALITLTKGTVDTVKTLSKAGAAIKLASQAIKLGGVTPISLKGYKILRMSAQIVGLKDTNLGTEIAQRIKRYEKRINKSIEVYKKVKTGIQKVKVTAAAGYQRVKTTVNVVRSLRRAGVPLTREHIRLLRQNLFHGVTREKVARMAKATGKAVAKGAFKGGVAVAKTTGKVAVKGGKWLGKGALSAANAVAGGLMASDDMALQGVGFSYTAARLGLKVGIKTAQVGFRGTKVGVKTAVKGGKGIARGIKFLRKNGFKASVKRLGSGIAKGFAQAGKSIVSFAVNLLKAAATKLIVPILIGIAAALGIVAICGAVGAVGTIFSGVYSDKDTGAEVEVSQYISSFASPFASAEQARLAGVMQAAKKPTGTNDIVRLYGADSDTLLPPTAESLAGLFPSTTELVNALGPIYNAVVLMDYELEPTAEEASALLNEMASGIFRCDADAAHTEYCGQSLATGEGTVEKCKDCKKVHAIKKGDNACPNCTTGTHKKYTEACCCSYKYDCLGHKKLTCTDGVHIHTDACYKTTSHGKGLSYNCGNAEKIHTCKGYRYCEGHTVTHFRFSTDGMYMLGEKYFDKPINVLLAIPAEDRTAEQAAQLSDLQSYQEIYYEMMAQFGLGGGMTMADLSGVKWVSAGNRKGNQEVVNLALTQVGVTGGTPYWRYFGFESWQHWCACFVHWSMRHTPSATDAWPNTGNNAYCPTIHNWFKNHGQFANRSFRNIVPGDVILIDWNCDGGADHVGLVIGRDDRYVYTVEGNRKNKVIADKYSLNSAVILGYCLMNY